MLKALARILILSYLIFFSPLASHLFSGDDKLTNSSAFDWRVISFPFEDRIWQGVLFDSANGWASCGSLIDGRLYRLLNGDWQFVPPQNNIYISDVLGLSPDSTWFICYDKSSYRHFLRHDDRGNITDFYTPNADPIVQLDFLAPDNIWAVCLWGQIIHFDGTSWQLVPCPTFTHITSISMVNDSCGWAGGKYRDVGYLLHWNGGQWQVKMQQKNLVPRVMMVNDTLGWGFLWYDSCLIRLTHDRWDLVTLASLTQDTIVATWQDVARPIFFNTSGIVTFGRGTSTVTYANRQRDILWFTAPVEKSDTKIYLLTHDGKVNYVRRQLPITPKLFWQYVGRAFEGATQEYGIAIGDIDSDGDDDIYSVNTSAENHLQLFGGNSQIKSVQSKEFTDAAGHLNIIGTPKSKEGLVIYDMGVTIADMDNDGDRDIYITSMYEKNLLYENIENRTFRDIAEHAGVSGGIVRSQVGIWGDVDNDGDIDLFVTNEDTTNMLFLNNGFGKFQEITHQAGLTTRRSGKGATFGDLDGDGDLDLVVPCFGVRNRIYRNEGIHPETRLPYFTDATDRWLPPEPDSLAKSTAACLADFDNDGDLDLFICNLVSSNRLYENDGMGRFTDITETAGLLDSSLTSSACFFDADNDGDLDLFLSNRGPNLFFKNLGDKKFVSNERTFKLAPAVYSNGVACGDPDNDGDLDLYVANNDDESIYYENNLDNKNYLEIKLIGTTSNRDAIGAKAFLYRAGHLDQQEYLLGMREVNGGYGYGCMNATTIHFGVQFEKRYDLKIWFPSGIEIIKTGLAPGLLLTIEEQSGLAKSLSIGKRFLIQIIKSSSYLIELIKFAALLTIFIIVISIVQARRMIPIRAQTNLLALPLFFYLVFDIPLFGLSFWISHILPIFAAISSFALMLLISRRQATQINREHLAEELLVSCKAFDHGSWATSYLNQLQLFSVNLPAKQPIPEKIGDQLRETIMGFYEVVYSEVNRIQQLATEASLQVNQANELGRQVLFLSENLNKIKVALALNKGLPAEIWKNVYRLVDQIKMNVREINYGVTRLFTCDAIAIIQNTLSAVENELEQQLIFPTADLQQQLWVCIKPNELSAIVDNLLQNARRAMVGQPHPKITIRLSQTDRHLMVEFSDNGCGIPKKLWEKIFDENYTTKSDGKGGFGLSYSRLRLEKYGGSIEVLKSGRNRGTTFLIKLRRA